MKLDAIEELAREAAAEPVRVVIGRRRNVPSVQAQLDLQDEVTPEFILAIVACIRAADAMRAFPARDDPWTNAYDFRRSALEQLP